MTTASSKEPIETLRELLNARPDRNKGQDGNPAFPKAVAEILNGYQIVWDKTLAELASAGLMGQSLTGFHQALLRRDVTLPRVTPDPARPWAAGDDLEFREDVAKALLNTPDEAALAGERLAPPFASAPPIPFTVLAVTSNQLEIEVKNGSAALGDQMLIEIKLPLHLVDARVRAAVDQAGKNQATPNMASLAGVVTAAAGWSVWAYDDSQSAVAAIRIYNYLDQQTGQASGAPVRIEADAALTLKIPLAPQATRTQITAPYFYQYGGRKGQRVPGSLELDIGGASKWKPKVSLTTDHPSSTLILPGRKVKIFWQIENGVSAVLRGPLSGGHSELRFSKESNSDFWIEKGLIEILAVSPATYLLDAQVRDPDSQTNVQVVRTLHLDVYTPGKYANLIVRPGRILPNGRVALEWAVWGSKTAVINIGRRKELKLELTEQDMSQNYWGTGTWYIDALSGPDNEKVTFRVEVDDKLETAASPEIMLAPWEKIDKRGFTGKPVAMAVAVPKMALLTTDGLWLTHVGPDDRDAEEKNFRKVQTDAPKAWLALTAFDKSFIILRQTDGDGLNLARYDADGKLQGTPVDLPDTVKSLVRLPGSFFDLAALGDRVYVVAQSSGGAFRHSFSVRFGALEKPRPEPWLERLTHYRLLTFDGGLYALHRGSGQMLRFDLTAKGELDQPRKAASAVKDGQSMIRKGLLVPVGSVLAVLDRDPFLEIRSELRALPLLGMTNVLDYVLENLAQERNPREVPQDVIYNPQKNEWAPCGHGLKIKPGAVAALREGASGRLWVLQPEGEMHTLTGASAELFSPDYVKRFPSASLRPALDGKLEFTLVNQSGINLVPVDDECRTAQLSSFSSTSVADLEPLPDKIPHGAQKVFKLSYNKAEPGIAWLRFLAEGSPGPRYVLQLTFSGPDLLTVTSVFKRLADGGQVAEVPDTSAEHSADRPIVVPRAARLVDKTTLFIINATPQDIGLYPQPGAHTVNDIAGIGVNYATPNFRVTIPWIEKVGDFWVNLDFAMPPGIEMSPGGEAQRSLVRINTDDIHMLNVRVQPLKASSPPFEYEMYGGIKASIPTQSADGYICHVGLKTKREYDRVRLGDAVASRDGKMLYLPLANPRDLRSAEVWRVEAGSFARADWSPNAQGEVFSMPNSISASADRTHAMFGDKTLQENDRNLLSGWKAKSFTEYKQITALAAAANGDLFMVAVKDKMVGYEKMTSYSLLAERVIGTREEVAIDNKISFPVLGPPMAVSPDGKTVAICHQGGLLVVNAQKIQSENIQSVKLSSAREPAYVTFSPDGVWLYCAHMTRALAGNPRRVISGRDLTVSRVRVSNLGDTKTIPLPNVDSNFGLTGNTRQSFSSGVQSKEEIAFTLAVSPDNRDLFVSAGAAILRIDTGSFALQQWRAAVELPCRLSYVVDATAKAWTVYALGSYYVGNGASVDEYKTHLYAIPVPK